MLPRMQTPMFLRVALVLVPSLAAVGCVYGTTQQVVRAHFASELSCPDARVEPTKRYEEHFKEGQMTASGCGTTRIYDCPADAGFVAYDEDVCSFRVLNTAKPAVAAPAADPMSDGSDPALDEPPSDEPMDEAPAEDTEPKAKGKASGKFKVGIGD
jgi:hypothetical protein